jgi:hypothetical protein
VSAPPPPPYLRTRAALSACRPAHAALVRRPAECLEIEIGDELFKKFNRIRALSDSAARLSAAHDAEASAMLADKMSGELMAMPLEEALPVLRAFGHYLK